jgi:cellulose biosynthesis protein BcsQ
MGQTITVYSTRGGSGKTITSVSIATTIAKRGYKTILIDVDIEAPSLIHLLPPKNPDIEYWTNYLDGDELELEDLIQETDVPNLSILYTSSPEMGKRFLQNKNRKWWENALKNSLLAQQKFYEIGYDFIILDNQSGTSMNSVNNMILADTSVLVVRPANYGVDATESFITEMYRILKGMKTRKDFYIWNQVITTTNDAEDALLENFLHRYNNRFTANGLELGCMIPFDRMLNLLLLNEIKETLFSLPENVQTAIDELVDKILATD